MKSTSVRTRLTLEEKNLVEQRAKEHAMSVSDFTRYMILNQETPLKNQANTQNSLLIKYEQLFMRLIIFNYNRLLRISELTLSEKDRKMITEACEEAFEELQLTKGL